MDSITVDKYTVEVGQENGKHVFRALRYGKEWIPNMCNVEGNNLMLAMFYRVLELEEELKGCKDEN